MNNDGANRGDGIGGGVRRPQQVLKPIGSFDEPIIGEDYLGIIPPPNNNFELTTSMLCLVERSTFKGSSIECPLEHLDRFERLCRLFKMNGVPEDTVRMMLFPFSLEDKGAYWERNVPSNQVSTWGNVKTEFLRKFFPKQRTAKLRNDIQSFEQEEDESLSDAWDRFKGYTRSCPHHGVTKENLLVIFYRGMLDEMRRTLDTASYGSFVSLNCEQAEQLIENLAQSDSWYEDDYDNTQASFQQGYFQPQEATPSQPSQDLDIKTMLQMIMEGQVRGQQETNEELQMEDPLEIALVVEKDEHGYLSEDANGFEEMLGESDEMVVEEPLELEVTELPKDEESDKEDHKGSAHDESWSELEDPILELNPLPKGLRYAFLGINSTYPEIINDALKDDEVNLLLVELIKSRKAIGYSLDDIQGISQSHCMHRTHLDFSVYCSPFGVLLSILCRLLWWLTLLLLALLVITKLKLFPGDKG